MKRKRLHCFDCLLVQTALHFRTAFLLSLGEDGLPLMLSASLPAWSSSDQFIFQEVFSIILSIFRYSLYFFLLGLPFFWSLHTFGRTTPSLSAGWCFGGQRQLWLSPCYESWSQQHSRSASAAQDWVVELQPAAQGGHYSAPTYSTHIP